jgi:hypothetical protein
LLSLEIQVLAHIRRARSFSGLAVAMNALLRQLDARLHHPGATPMAGVSTPSLARTVRTVL